MDIKLRIIWGKNIYKERCQEKYTNDHTHMIFTFPALTSSSEQASASHPQIAYLSISTPPPSPEDFPTDFLNAPCRILRVYKDFAEIVDPPRTGFLLTLRLNFPKIFYRKGMKLLIILVYFNS